MSVLIDGRKLAEPVITSTNTHDRNETSLLEGFHEGGEASERVSLSPTSLQRIGSRVSLEGQRPRVVADESRIMKHKLERIGGSGGGELISGVEVPGDNFRADAKAKL